MALAAHLTTDYCLIEYNLTAIHLSYADRSLNAAIALDAPVKRTYVNYHRFSHVFSFSKAKLPPKNWWDMPLLETQNFIAIASIGALYPGWVLIIPKRPASNLALLSHNEKTELEEVSSYIKTKIAQPYNTIYEFEHGDAFGSKHRCGVDQAHLHVVPLAFDMLAASSSYDCDLPWISLEEAKLPPTKYERAPYLFIRSQNCARIAKPAQPLSQWFRRVIAETTKNPNQWDYKRYPLLENVAITQSMFLQ